MPAAKTAHLDLHAIATLRYIRASMDAAGSVAIPGSAGIAMGAVGLAATALSLLPHLQSHWLFIWLIAAPFAATVGAVLLARSGSITSFVAAGTPGRRLALGLAPSLFAGAIVTLLLWRGGQSEAIAGTWLLLYGCALISASVSTARIVTWMGSCFVALALAALCVPFVMQIALLGVGFGGLHILFGILIGRGAHGR